MDPAFSDKIQREYLSGAISAPTTMPVGGITVKTIFLLIVLVAAGAWGWASATEPVAVDVGSGYANTTVTIPGGFWLASFGALFVGIVVTVQPRRAAPFGVIYAALEWHVLGAISAMFDAQTEGIVGAAVIGTVCVSVAAVVLYALRIVRPTNKMAFGPRQRSSDSRCSISSSSSCRSSTGAGSTATASARSAWWSQRSRWSSQR